MNIENFLDLTPVECAALYIQETLSRFCRTFLLVAAVLVLASYCMESPGIVTAFSINTICKASASILMITGAVNLIANWSAPDEMEQMKPTLFCVVGAAAYMMFARLTAEAFVICIAAAMVLSLVFSVLVNKMTKHTIDALMTAEAEESNRGAGWNL